MIRVCIVSVSGLEHRACYLVLSINKILTSRYPVPLKMTNLAQSLYSKFQMSNVNIPCKPDR